MCTSNTTGIVLQCHGVSRANPVGPKAATGLGSWGQRSKDSQTVPWASRNRLVSCVIQSPFPVTTYKTRSLLGSDNIIINFTGIDKVYIMIKLYDVRGISKLNIIKGKKNPSGWKGWKD